MIGIDTTLFIDLVKGDEKAIATLEQFTDKAVTTVINVQELMFGVYRDIKRYKKEQWVLEQLFGSMKTLPLTKEATKMASEVFWEIKGKHQEIGKFDAMIIGILKAHGVTKLITKNKKHFKHVKGLQVISY